jgi:hypothetical protein
VVLPAAKTFFPLTESSEGRQYCVACQQWEVHREKGAAAISGSPEWGEKCCELNTDREATQGSNPKDGAGETDGRPEPRIHLMCI